MIEGYILIMTKGKYAHECVSKRLGAVNDEEAIEQSKREVKKHGHITVWCISKLEEQKNRKGEVIQRYRRNFYREYID